MISRTELFIWWTQLVLYIILSILLLKKVLTYNINIFIDTLRIYKYVLCQSNLNPSLVYILPIDIIPLTAADVRINFLLKSLDTSKMKLTDPINIPIGNPTVLHAVSFKKIMDYHWKSWYTSGNHGIRWKKY